jgi:hypothetical protein
VGYPCFVCSDISIRGATLTSRRTPSIKRGTLKLIRDRFQQSWTEHTMYFDCCAQNLSRNVVDAWIVQQHGTIRCNGQAAWKPQMNRTKRLEPGRFLNGLVCIRWHFL